MHRLYEYGDIAVFWDSEKCRHQKKCVTGSPQTFDFGRRPWIDLTKAPTAEIWKTVNKCPTGALTCVYTHNVKIETDMDNCRSVAFSVSETGVEEQIGECDFKRSKEGWIIYHTEVSPEFSEKGIAKRLVYKLAEAAEREGADIIPTCSYAKKVLSCAEDGE